MRKITLMVMMMAIYATSFSQACLVVTSAAFTNPSNDGTNWTLTINFTASGNKTLEVYVRCGTTQIFYDCFQSNGPGTKVYTGILCPGGIDSLMATFTPRTGACGSAACSPSFILPPGGGPLPVRLSSFFSKRNSNTVTLHWKTETEINSKAFILERQTSNGFITVATITASGNANGSSYSYIDNNINRGISQYRLKVIDQDGTYSYSNISAVKGISTANDFTVFPNPSNGSAKVTISDISEPTDVQLVDISGRLIKNVSVNNSNIVELNNLQKGMYMIRIVNKSSGESVTQKLTVIN